MTEAPFETIVVVTDGSESAGDALTIACDLARHHSSELVVLSVAPLPGVYSSPGEPFVPPTVPANPVPYYRAIVEAAVEKAQAAGVENVTGVCEEGAVIDEILHHLRQHPPDLLVVGSRGLSTAKRLLLGSVSTALVTHAPCPVLVARPKPTTPPSGEA